MLDDNNPNKICIRSDGFYVLPDTHSEYFNLLRLQIENNELLKWKSHLQKRIVTERMEILNLKSIIQSNNVETTSNENERNPLLNASSRSDDDSYYAWNVSHYMKENALLEQKKQLLGREIFQENKEYIQLQVDMAMQKLSI